MEGSGLVEVGSLVEFIRKMQLGQQESGEDVYDSEEDVSLLPGAGSGWLLPYRLYSTCMGSLVPRHLKNKIKKPGGAPGIHCSRMRDSPGFSGELGSYCDTSPCCMTVHY